MYKLDLKPDLKEQARIERRRALEEERKGRIFNAKTRLIGVDEQAIQQQIHDRQFKEDREKQRDEAFHADATRNDAIALLMEAREREDRKQINVAMNEFRDMHQQPQARREWDLYDPDGQKKDKPARVSDEDPRCGPASIQRFDGEDLNRKAREQFQKQQSESWWEQQREEKDMAKCQQEKADYLYDLKRQELDQRALELAQAEEECRKAINMAQSNYNNALASETAEKRRLTAQKDLDDKLTEIANHVFGDFLTENPTQARSLFGAHRVVPDRWKGMSEAELAQIRRIQAEQVEEKNRLKEEEQQEGEEWDRQRVAQARAAQLFERETERTRRELRDRLSADNSRLGQQQRHHNDFLDKEVYTNEPTAAYFMQFNTTTR